MVDFPNDESLMTCGLDSWEYPRTRGESSENCATEFLVVEERLQNRLGVDHFRLPPDFRDPGPGVRYPNFKIPFVRFPQWHYCPRCGSMGKLGLFANPQRCTGPDYKNGLRCNELPATRRPWLLPVRFVTVCAERGHISDFPFMEWVHRDLPVTGSCRLRLRAGRSAAGLSGITLQCSYHEDSRATMSGVFKDGALSGIEVFCGGERPWLGDVEHREERCKSPLRVLQRGASNIYFPHVASSIYLPLWGERESRETVAILEELHIWTILSTGLVDGKIDLERCRTICGIQPWRGLKPEELRRAAQRKLDGLPPEKEAEDASSFYQEEEKFRQEEYEALRTGRGGMHTDLHSKQRFSSDYEEPIAEFFSTVTLVEKLRETRVLYGFSRYLPDDDRSYDDQIGSLKLNGKLKWLPAIVVRGEGIFFEIDSEQLDSWLSRRGVQERADELAIQYNRVRKSRSQIPRVLSARFLMIHTLAHLVMNQLSIDCGYGSASLRERIYCDAEYPETPMNGFLIYTASGDSEGTMGGLVRQGQPGRLEGILLRALQKAIWCSYDPLCMESGGQGPDSCNLAACHGCAVLPETSCEEGNRLLDRALVIGLPENSGMGLFGPALE